MQLLMETVCNRLSSYLPCYATAYGNGVSVPKTIYNRFRQPLMEMGMQPLMETGM
jgi:hypothetical protein